MVVFILKALTVCSNSSVMKLQALVLFSFSLYIYLFISDNLIGKAHMIELRR